MNNKIKDLHLFTPNHNNLRNISEQSSLLSADRSRLTSTTIFFSYNFMLKSLITCHGKKTKEKMYLPRNLHFRFAEATSDPEPVAVCIWPWKGRA